MSTPFPENPASTSNPGGAPNPASATRSAGGEAPRPEQELPASVRSAPDLGRVASGAGAQGGRPAAAEAGSGATTDSYRWQIDSPESFQEVAQLSGTGPVVVALYKGSDQAAVDTVETLEEFVDSARGHLLLGAGDIEKVPELAEVLGASSSLTVVALLGGRPAPMFNEPVPAEQIQALLGQVLQLAQQAQLTGVFQPVGQKEAVEKPLPPLHQEALAALDRKDYDAARTAYQKALSENPGDHEAKLGLSRVGLLSRTADEDPAEVRSRAAADPQDVPAQLRVADLDVSTGHVEDAFTRLIGIVRRGPGEDREAARERLLELFDVVGLEDPRVVAARKQLMLALF